MNVVQLSGQGRAISGLTGEKSSRSGSSLLAGGNLEFADLLMARGALDSSSKVLPDGASQDEAAPAASEFAAVALFRAGVQWDQEAVALGGEQVAASDAVTATGSQVAANHTLMMPGERGADATLGQASIGLPEEGAVLAGSADQFQIGRSSGPLRAAAEEAGMYSGSVFPAIGRIAASRAMLAFDEVPEQPHRTALPPRATALTKAGAVTLTFSTDGDEASVAARVTGLADAEAQELNRRIRDELDAAQIGVRGIRINGRRAPAFGTE